MIVAIAIALVVSIFFIWKYKYIKRLKEIRDDFDLTTKEGRFLIRCYNYKIDKLNGSHLWKSKKLI
jgi:hypothetical protein